MRILGIDPGSRHTGYGLVESEGERLRAVDYGSISPPGRAPVAERLAFLADGLRRLLERWQPQAAVLETPFHGLNSRSLVVLAEARGALLATLAAHGLEISEYSPAEVKSAVAGHGRADKQQVARVLRLMLELPGDPPQSDATDALALAVCYAHRYRIDRLARQSRHR